VRTRIDEIADGIFRLSTFASEVAPPEGFTFCQFLVVADEPLLYHCGLRAMYPLTAAAIGSLMPIERLRWISFGHVEADECGAMNALLAAAPRAQVVYSALGCEISVADMAERPPRPMANGEVLDLGGKRITFIETPHVPHGWEAQVIHEESTGTLFCGDLFGHVGDSAALTETDILGPAIQAEDLFHPTSLGVATAPTIRKLAMLSPRTLALMHGSSYRGDCRAALLALADHYDQRLRASLEICR
jgi:flavorubredoxin